MFESLRLPLVVAPMGGQSTPELAAAGCNAGALGSLACAYQEPAAIGDAISKLRGLTTKPFLVNLFNRLPEPRLEPAVVERAVAAARDIRRELGLADPVVKPPFHPDFDRQMEVVLREKPAVFSFCFGVLEPEYVRACHERGIFVMGTATTVDEGLALADSGVDAITAQGTEAGGHRAIFDPSAPEPGVSTLDLVRDLAAKVRVPIVAAGGLMTGADIARALRAGAKAAALGTAFLLTPEVTVSAPWREALRAGGETVLTRAFSGRLARGLANRFHREIHDWMPFPVQNAFTRDIRTVSAKAGRPDFLSLWTGTGVSRIRAGLTASELVAELETELRTTS